MTYYEIVKCIILEAAFMADIEDCKASERGNLTRADFWGEVDQYQLAYLIEGEAV